MREREKTRRETRKGKYGENPDLHEEDKAIARRKYYARMGRMNKTIIEEALQRTDIAETTRTLLSQLAEDSSAITTAALRKMISGDRNKTMPRGVKKVEEKVEEGVVVPVVPPVEEVKKEKKEKKEKKVITTSPGEVLHIKIEKGVTVKFD
jgi:hypothetical protein